MKYLVCAYPTKEVKSKKEPDPLIHVVSIESGEKDEAREWLDRTLMTRAAKHRQEERILFKTLILSFEEMQLGMLDKSTKSKVQHLITKYPAYALRYKKIIRSDASKAPF